MRVLMRRLETEKVEVTRPVWEINTSGYGHAVYALTLGGHVYSLIAFATPLDADKRSDRVIAEAWDASFVLFDGMPTREDLDRLALNVPRQEAGRFSSRELVLSRANKSLRLFAHIVDALASGRQPDAKLLGETGYLMRTTAVYGNGKMGFADRAILVNRPHLSGPFQPEMLTVWLIREFTLDLVQHIAFSRNPVAAVRLCRAARRNLGIGNSTGLGMAPFLVNHAGLLNAWILARETGLARVLGDDNPAYSKRKRVVRLLARARAHCRQWNVADSRQMNRILQLRIELDALAKIATVEWLAAPSPWKRLVALADTYSIECQELVIALILEVNGDLVDDLAATMADDAKRHLDPTMTLANLRAVLDRNYRWALDMDFTQPNASAMFWYVSADKLEPRLGRRAEEDGADCEQPLDIARQAQNLARDIDAAPDGQGLPVFLLAHPEHRYIVRRVQLSQLCPYSEIRDNLIAEGIIPLDMLRFKLAAFGAAKFDPKSNLWTRITLYQGAPLGDEIGTGHADDWWLPVLEEI